jgi:hypothetical protein
MCWHACTVLPLISLGVPATVFFDVPPPPVSTRRRKHEDQLRTAVARWRHIELVRLFNTWREYRRADDDEDEDEDEDAAVDDAANAMQISASSVPASDATAPAAPISGRKRGAALMASSSSSSSAKASDARSTLPASSSAPTKPTPTLKRAHASAASPSAAARVDKMAVGRCGLRNLGNDANLHPLVLTSE